MLLESWIKSLQIFNKLSHIRKSEVNFGLKFSTRHSGIYENSEILSRFLGFS